MNIPYWLVPCDHPESMGWRKRTHHFLVVCRDPVLMQMRWRREIGLAGMVVGFMFVTLGIAELIR